MLSAALVLGLALAAGARGDKLPVVDLGHSLHRGALNEAGDVYVFKNIRFGEPPVGGRRFRPAGPVATVNRTVDDGAVDYICPQAFPEWYVRKGADAMGLAPEAMRALLEAAPAQSEDCLFLDVWVPKKIYRRSASGPGTKGAPVLVWICGGGYIQGSKNRYNPTGLLARSMKNNGDGIVYVGIDYRLGLYGFLNGDGDADIVPNVGFHDQRLALNGAVNKYIHLFGGDGGDVTVLGESAGAGSIMHHITAEGGAKKVPFGRAIIQSPGFPIYSDVAATWRRVLATASRLAGREVRSGAELAALDGPTLLAVNRVAVAESPGNSYTFGPTVDGAYVPDFPGALLRAGRFDGRPRLMIGQNSHEGRAYVGPGDNDAAAIRAKAESVLPDLSAEDMDYVWTELYPPPPQTGLYGSESDRGALLFTEAFFTCNTRFLAAAFHNDTWSYRFQVPPGEHGQDVAYTFYSAGGVGAPADARLGPVDARLAGDMQQYMLNFAATGSPNAPPGRLPEWPPYGDRARLLTFGPEGVGTGSDEVEGRSRRCAFWQSGVGRAASRAAKGVDVGRGDGARRDEAGSGERLSSGGQSLRGK
ncbi:hypothetical protein CDD83_360 [Cordyceps sp. RAO-2017]|nr:hypothetical protein CDD83_360 [Cordyceps sp. RAO-2017]